MTNSYQISAEEFSKKRSVFKFCNWLKEKFSEMGELDNFDEIYFERKGDYVKKIIEEALPMSRLGLYFSTPFNDVHITCYGTDKFPDACIEIEDAFRSRKMEVEITTTETYNNSVMKRQALAREGTVVLTGRAKKDKRDKRKIIINSQFVETETEEQKTIDLMFERFLDKVTKPNYDNKTAILVCHTYWRPVRLSNRNELVQRTKHYLQAEKLNIHIFYCYLGQNVVDEATINSK